MEMKPEEGWLMEQEIFDVAVIGGGASGLAAAISAARAGASACVVERDVEAGLPILATGNGRCNISNERLDPARYLHPDVAASVFGEAGTAERELDSFFRSVGIRTLSIDGRLYPYSKRAEAVRDALLRACTRLGVQIETASQPSKAEALDDDLWRLTAYQPTRPLRGKPQAGFKVNLRARRKELSSVSTRKRTVLARSVVIACGGASEAVARLFGLDHLDETPVLCPLACRIDGHLGVFRHLDGLRVDAALTLVRDGSALYRETGEVLFRDYGISGIVAFDLSRRARPGDTVRIDPFPDMDDPEVSEMLAERKRIIGDPAAAGPAWFDGLLARPLSDALYDLGKDLDAPFARTIDALVTGTAEERSAQVRRGGIPLTLIDPSTMRVSSEDVKGRPPLFACGEALDQDADCGGFNLAWAWMTGLRAGSAAASTALTAPAAE